MARMDNSFNNSSHAAKFKQLLTIEECGLPCEVGSLTALTALDIAVLCANVEVVRTIMNSAQQEDAYRLCRSPHINGKITTIGLASILDCKEILELLSGACKTKRLHA
jgi:hypothetical protein